MADLVGSMGNFLNATGMNGNTTSSHAYQNQSASYYSGGSLYARNQQGSIQIAQLDMPSLSSGCGGIDAFLGGFSFIKEDEIVGFVKQLMSSAEGYMFDLALEITVPELKTVKDFAQKISNSVNSLNVNSCEMTQDLVGGLWPKTQASNRKICEDIGSNDQSIFSDWAAARQGCGAKASDNADKSFNQADDEQKKELLKNKNLIWENLTAYAGLGSDTDLKEFLMSITGTIVFDEKNQAKFYPAQITDEGFINAFLYGTNGRIKGKEYHCNDSVKCLSPAVSDLNIPSNRSFFNLIQSQINGLRESISQDKPLTREQQSFIAASPMPIMKYIMVEQESGIAGGVDDNTIVDVLAKSVLVKFFESSVQKVRDSLEALSYSPDIAQKVLDRIEFAQKAVTQMKNDNAKLLEEITLLNNHYQLIEKQLSSGLSDDLKANQNF